MSNEKLTPWFKGDVKPARKGVYQREYGAGCRTDIRFSYWDGARWRWPSKESAETASDHWRCRPPSAIVNLRWRGLASEPKGVA